MGTELNVTIDIIASVYWENGIENGKKIIETF